MIKIIKYIKLSLLTLLVAAALTACNPQVNEQPLDEITVQLKWMHQSQFAGFYAADLNGFYEEENIEVTFIEGGPTVDITAAVLDGSAQFAVAAADELIVDRANGREALAIATVYQISPQVFVADAGSGITIPENFIGKKILVSQSAVPSLVAMMNRVGIKRDQYTFDDIEMDVDLFASGEFPIWGVYLTGSIDILQQAGYDLNIIFPEDYGVHFYADVLITSDSYAALNPDLSLRFLRATLRGWRWAIENADDAGMMALQYNPELDGKVQVAQLEESIPFIHTGEAPVGWMSQGIWRSMTNTLLDQGLLSIPIDVEGVYSMQLLNDVYGSGP